MREGGQKYLLDFPGLLPSVGLEGGTKIMDGKRALDERLDRPLARH